MHGNYCFEPFIVRAALYDSQQVFILLLTVWSVRLSHYVLYVFLVHHLLQLYRQKLYHRVGGSMGYHEFTVCIC